MSPLPEVQNGSEEPLYNIGAVARLTGVTMVTLRAWERRYNFPEAERTAGGHRLYSEKDILRLRWVKERIDEGMQTAQAIGALRYQEQAGHMVSAPEVLPSRPVSEGQAGSHLLHFHDPLLDALLKRDIARADLVLGEAQSFATPDDLILDLISPAFTKIGEAWENGQISVATEHLATNYLRQRLLTWMLAGPTPKTMKPIVLGCAPNEWHEGSLLILGALLRRRRWPVAYLGQAVPLPDLAGFVRDLQPPLVVLVAMTDTAAADLVEWPRWLPEAAQNGKPAVGYGGRIFTLSPDWRRKMPGIYLGDTLQEGLDSIERLLG